MNINGAELTVQLNGSSIYLGIRGTEEQITERFWSMENGGFLERAKLHWVTDDFAYVWISRDTLLRYFVSVQAAQLWTKHRMIAEGKTWQARAEREAEAYFESLPRQAFFVSRAKAVRHHDLGVAEGLTSFPKEHSYA